MEWNEIWRMPAELIPFHALGLCQCHSAKLSVDLRTLMTFLAKHELFHCQPHHSKPGKPAERCLLRSSTPVAAQASPRECNTVRQDT